MNEKQKDEVSGTEDKFSELGQQAGAMLGQLFASAEQFGRQVSKESQAWADSEPSKEPLVTALREAGEEFRASANRAAENLSDSVRRNTGQPGEAGSDADNSDSIKPGNVRKIGGAVEASQWSNADDVNERSSAVNERASADRVAIDRAAQLAEIFQSDPGLSELSAVEFDALKTLLEKQYRSVREFQGSK